MRRHFRSTPDIRDAILIPWDERQPTPLDGLGRVDGGAVVRLVLGSLDPAYTSPDGIMVDRHHLQWPRSAYQDDEQAAAFRNLSGNSLLLPRDIHNALHRITLPPPLPKVEVMRQSCQAEQALRQLSRLGAEALRLVRRQAARGIPDTTLRERLGEKYTQYRRSLDYYQLTIPEVYWSVPPRSLQIETIEELCTQGSRLGRVVPFVCGGGLPPRAKLGAVPRP